MMTKDAIGDLSLVLHGNKRGTMISGTPGVIAMARQLAAQGRARARQAQRDTASSVHEQMRETARKSPGWHGLENGIVMRQKPDGSATYGFDPQHPQVDRATELEFGATGKRPESIFRKVLMGRQPAIERELHKRMNP